MIFVAKIKIPDEAKLLKKSRKFGNFVEILLNLHNKN